MTLGVSLELMEKGSSFRVNGKRPWAYSTSVFGGWGRLLSGGRAYEGLKKKFKFRIFVFVCFQIDGTISQEKFYDGIASS